METRAHARLGPSAAHRWIHCPASVRVAEKLESEGADTSSTYAAEGTAAHTIAEIVASNRFGQITDDMMAAAIAAWKGSYAGAAWLPEDVSLDEALEEMLMHADTYADLIGVERARQHTSSMHLELKVFPGVESVWGTGDCVASGPEIITIIDYKYGTGVRVNAEGNEQLMFYALGAYEADMIGLATTVRMIVCQPRLDHVSEWEIPVAQLLEWRDTVARPAAELALTDDAPFGPSDEACRFCPARGSCRAQMEWVIDRDFGEDLDTLDNDDYAKALEMLPAIRLWATSVEEKALERAYSKGENIPGWKVVQSGGQRKITDEEAAVEKLVAAGYNREDVERTKVSIQTFAVLDKVVRVGKTKVLAEVLGKLLGKSEGRPSLVPESDKRPTVTANDSAAADFADLEDD